MDCSLLGALVSEPDARVLGSLAHVVGARVTLVDEDEEYVVADRKSQMASGSSSSGGSSSSSTTTTTTTTSGRTTTTRSSHGGGGDVHMASTTTLSLRRVRGGDARVKRSALHISAYSYDGDCLLSMAHDVLFSDAAAKATLEDEAARALRARVARAAIALGAEPERDDYEGSNVGGQRRLGDEL